MFLSSPIARDAAGEVWSFQIPKSKSQIPNKFQTQVTEMKPFENLSFGHWGLFAVWCWVFGTFSKIRSKII
jgi:hypothetical protein